tara:strand:- start:14 stop:184 length:171 start_codon:yes stop_codon:yes gene_type:complete
MIIRKGSIKTLVLELPNGNIDEINIYPTVISKRLNKNSLLFLLKIVVNNEKFINDT